VDGNLLAIASTWFRVERDYKRHQKTLALQKQA
jgi:hypothetical protein